MTNRKVLIKIFTRAVALFLLLDGFYHFTGLRWIGIEEAWSSSAVNYFIFFNFLWGSASIMLGVFLWIASRDTHKYAAFLLAFAWLGIGHSVILYYFSLMYLDGYTALPALYLWNPWYSWQLRLEALGLNIYTFLIFYDRYFAKRV